MSNGSPGALMGVDWEQRVDFDTLRRDRLARAKAALEASDLGALLLFDPNNIRYVTSTHIGEWARDKNARYVFLPREGDPILWDFGSAARHHQMYAPWLPPESFRAGVTPMRGAMPVETGVPDALGAQQVEAINAVSGDRCNPHPHVFSDRLLRPGDQAFFDIIHSFMGYRTCYYRTFNVGGVSQSQLDAYKQCREWLDAAIELVRPGVTTDQIASVWPTAEELGFPNEEACFGLQFGHGLGVGLYEAPMISRVHSLENPMELEEGMVFSLETYCAASDGISAARIEEEVVVTAHGNRLLTRFPAEDLLVAGRTYVRGADLVVDDAVTV